ncbi:MAG: LysR family transcriptional regulator [Myxococcales bacterium]|nr:LysR family transcriptional regulator [Myxococcales bacterium]
MELQQIRYFLAVVEARNFTRAAERCHVSQPALTKAIKKLEAELDGPLLHRDRSGPQLTTLGELVLPRLRSLVRESDAVLEIAGNHRLLRQVPLRLGVLRTIGPARLAEHLQEFRTRAPSVELEVAVLDHHALVTGLEEASLELAITNADVEQRDWMVVRPLYAERYCVALPPGHALAERRRIALRELAGERYIDRLACELREQVASICAAQGIELYASYRSADEAWIECMVRAGVGLALLPEHSIVSADTVRRELVEPRVDRRIALLRSAEHPSSPAAKALWDTLLAAGA